MMTMDMITGINGTPLSPDTTLPCATEIGREFVRQYYTLLSERPQDVHRFYSHESVFIHGELEAVGQQNIERAIDSLGFDECKVRIHTIKGSHTHGQGIALQVCGEMQENERCEPRCFIQTIVLCQQTPKKFFVQNNIFQFSNSCFNVLEKEKSVPAVEPKLQQPATIIPPPSVNGHESSSQVAEKAVKDKSDNHHLNSEKERKHAKAEKKKDDAPGPAPEPIVVSEHIPHESKGSTEVPQVPMKGEQKSWAKLVGGGNDTALATASTIKSTIAKKENHQDKTDVRQSSNVQKEEKKAYEKTDDKDMRSGKKDERGAKLYIGGIVRNKIPELLDENTVIAEIFSVFAVYGEVEGVQVPRKCYEAPINAARPGTAFAFVSMKNVAEAQKVFNACRKDESKASIIKASIPSFGFDGEVSVSVSEPKLYTGPRSGPGFIRRGGSINGGRGSFAPRGISRVGRGSHFGNN